MRGFISRIKWGLLFIGVMFLGLGIFSVINAKKPAADLYDLDFSEYKDGKMVEADIYCNIGVYEESYSTNYGIKNKATVVWHYAIPIGDEEYMGIAVNAKRRGDQFDAQTDATYDWMMYDNAPEPEAIHVRGRMTKMDKDDTGYIQTLLREFGYTSAEAAQLTVPYYIKVDAFSDYKILLILGPILTALGVVAVIATRRRRF